MLEEFSNPTLLDEQVDQENFVDIISHTVSQKDLKGKLKQNLLVLCNQYMNKELY